MRRTERGWIAATLGLGLLAFAVALARFQTVDGDLWARLAVGAQVWHTGHVLPHDVYAFTPTLPEWIDHEWGAGVIFFGVLRWFGPVGLMGLKILLALGALWCAMKATTFRSRDSSQTRDDKLSVAILLLALPCAFCVLPGYVPVIRSHALSFLFFGLTLWGLETVRAGRCWPLPALVALMLVWANVHGGFVVGLGTIAVYAALVAPARRALLITFAAAVAVTLVNPYGLRFWTYLIPALLHPRPDIAEWGRMPLWGNDPYLGFRILFVVAAIVIVARWRRLTPVGAVMLLVTAAFAIRSRRHAPFFGLAALVYLTPCLLAGLARVRRGEAARWRSPLRAGPLVFGLYAAVTAGVCLWILPRASLEPAVPNGYYPVRAVDVLELAGVEGNLAIPFRWGSYASWRLFPKIKVSVDGRYEETYPEETFEMNRDLFYKRGPDWDRLLTKHRVDFLILDHSTTALCADDLHRRGYTPVYTDRATALFARGELVDQLSRVAATLPPTTREPLDARLPERWWQ